MEVNKGYVKWPVSSGEWRSKKETWYLIVLHFTWSHWENFCSESCSHFKLNILRHFVTSLSISYKNRDGTKAYKTNKCFQLSGPALTEKGPSLKAEGKAVALYWAFFSLLFSGGTSWIENCFDLQNENSRGLDSDVMHLSHPSYGRNKAFSRDWSAPVIPASLWSLGGCYRVEQLRVSGATLA